MSEMTRMQIEEMRSYNPNEEGPLTAVGLENWQAICDLALRALEPSPEREGQRTAWQRGIDDAWAYLRGSTFSAPERDTVDACLALLKELRANLMWGPNDDPQPKPEPGGEVARSQVDAFGAKPVRTWADYRAGCLGTYGGGHEGKELDAFRHGMETVFNLLEAEFPPAEVCKALYSQNVGAERVVVPRERLQAALNYIKHVGANTIMRGEPHPQQQIVDWLDAAMREQEGKS